MAPAAAPVPAVPLRLVITIMMVPLFILAMITVVMVIILVIEFLPLQSYG
jgi:hypothetical protein